MDIGNSIERGFDVFFAWLPSLLAAIAIVVVGYVVARLVAKLVGRGLRAAGFDRIVQKGPGGSFVGRLTTKPSGLLAAIAFWALFLGALSLAVTALGIDALTNFVGAVYAYLPNVLAAVLIFLVAGAIAATVATLATRFLGDTALGKVVATAAPILVLTIATFMVLDQLRIAENIVVITYAALLGAIALGSALAFGLGGRDVARELLESAYSRGQENKGRWKSELETGRDRAREETRAQKQRLGV